MSEECCVRVEIPKPVVKRPRLVRFRGVDVGVRVGRGFSIGEIEAAGIDTELARQLNIPVDFRRRSVYGENVENLKVLLNRVYDIIGAVRVKPARNIAYTSRE